jgi:hypothetical protein
MSLLNETLITLSQYGFNSIYTRKAFKPMRTYSKLAPEFPVGPPNLPSQCTSLLHGSRLHLQTRLGPRNCFLQRLASRHVKHVCTMLVYSLPMHRGNSFWAIRSSSSFAVVAMNSTTVSWRNPWVGQTSSRVAVPPPSNHTRQS